MTETSGGVGGISRATEIEVFYILEDEQSDRSSTLYIMNFKGIYILILEIFSCLVDAYTYDMCFFISLADSSYTFVRCGAIVTKQAESFYVFPL